MRRLGISEHQTELQQNGCCFFHFTCRICPEAGIPVQSSKFRLNTQLKIWKDSDQSVAMQPTGALLIGDGFICRWWCKDFIALYLNIITQRYPYDGWISKIKRSVHEYLTCEFSSTRAEPFSFVSVKLVTSSFNSCVRAVQTREDTRIAMAAACWWFLWWRLVNSIGLLTTFDRQLRSWHAPFLLCRWSLRPFRSYGTHLLASCTV